MPWRRLDDIKQFPAWVRSIKPGLSIVTQVYILESIAAFCRVLLRLFFRKVEPVLMEILVHPGFIKSVTALCKYEKYQAPSASMLGREIASKRTNAIIDRLCPY